ncbi:hypothetical protein MNEG_14500 [Monoraphidium neglectum]|uniref:Uncharacterized protein n=1 Tax=Monoraphidium neglectum TaxID=145388 RepID=A0A0D2J051_9CHLO|nr:hypothetical protein MNEG_14500 [Monoraphidium neglectum]KIY93462.1 hypothetical protein MNEG_14500 [Monoraphidium neglectum]|eukprot:XP_013892482.1 hypothetical protein MNEG_14500 [Monoraphidium neglectum]
MLGGKLPVAAAAAAAAAGGEPGARHDRGKATAAMPVQDFLDQGLGGAQLPRKQQDRKEREKQKRQKGQSTHAEWKPESWMVLRQQYDG